MKKTLLKTRGEIVNINQHKLHLYRSGNPNKPKLVFMSGSGTISPVYDFKVLYEKLLKDFRIIVIEKFGYGYSDIFENDCHIDNLVSIQKEALSILGEKGPYILVPHSMSGLEAIRWAQKFPEDIHAIIGLDMATPISYERGFSPEIIEKKLKMIQILKKLKIQSLVCQINNRSLTKEEKKQHQLLRKRNALNICIEQESKRVLENAEILRNCKNPEVPVLLFSSSGKFSPDYWVKSQKDFAKTINGRLHFLQCGHYLHHFKSEEISKEIKNFVTELKLNQTENPS